jgi:coenzyme PQQ precursor peptide PqqA
MTWIKPDFEEIRLSMEVTAYSNAADELPVPPSDEPLSEIDAVARDSSAAE